MDTVLLLLLGLSVSCRSQIHFDEAALKAPSPPVFDVPDGSPDEDFNFRTSGGGAIVFPDRLLVEPFGKVKPKPGSSTIFFPQEVIEHNAPLVEGHHRCTAFGGLPGQCRTLVQCAEFYDDILQQPINKCKLFGGNVGVCCPFKKKQNERVTSHGVVHSPPTPNVQIVFPTDDVLHDAIMNGIDEVNKRKDLESQLFTSNNIVHPGTAENAHQQFFQTSEEVVGLGENGQINVETSHQVQQIQGFDNMQSTFGLPQISISQTEIADTCPKEPLSCSPVRYRSIDGVCNNLQNKNWGKAETAFQRVLPPKYVDGVSLPRSESTVGGTLPSARLVSSKMITDNPRASYQNYTLLLMQWGQFLDHDITFTPISKGKSLTGITCCSKVKHPDCFPIDIPFDDPFYGKFREKCMNFVRSMAAPRRSCNLGPREQMNQITAYIDASNVYGSKQDTALDLQERRGGRLKVQHVDGRILLPSDRRRCVEASTLRTCFKAGDVRCNEQLQLVVMHTLWMREHNRIAHVLASLNPHWDDETLYQEARRIVGAEMQHITYNEFLPIVLGQRYMAGFDLLPQPSGFTHKYNSTIDASITNVFATAAYRYGHSLIQATLMGFNENNRQSRNFPLHETQFKPFEVYEEDAIDDLIRGLTMQKSSSFDVFFTKELTNHLFQQRNRGFGMDLVALNVQRGRDHGLPPYNDWREICGLPKARNWDDFADVIKPRLINVLKSIYRTVDDVDLYIGGLTEEPLHPSLLGHTFLCLVGDQFIRLRLGDRFFYEEGGQRSSFTEAQLSELRKSSLARVMCDNSDDLQRLQPLVFRTISEVNQMLSCDSDGIPHIDLTPWREER